MNRRNFIKTGLLTTGALGLSSIINKNYQGGNLYAASGDTSLNNYDLIAVKGGEPDVMFDKGIAAFGGISKLVKKGDTVVVKPNIGWNKTIEYGANTNPKLIKRIIEHCYNAGAKKVYVFDHTCDDWKSSYKNSGIEAAAKNAGAQVVPGNTEGYYEKVSVSRGKKLKNAKVHELIMDSDVFINVPVLKHHGGARLTIAMKNLMGIVWDRGYFHYSNLNQCIADINTYRKPDLNIVDAYYVMMKNGPRGKNKSDLVLKKSQLISKDIVAVDSAAAKIFGSQPYDIQYIKDAHDLKIGTMDLTKLNIKKISI